MTTTTINGKIYNITSHVFKRTLADTMKLGLTEHVKMFKALAEISGQKISNNSISVVDVDSNHFYSNISLGDYRRRYSFSKWVYDSIVGEKGYNHAVRTPELQYSPVYHENITGHRFVFAVDCPIEYLEDIYMITVCNQFDFIKNPDGPGGLYEEILEKWHKEKRGIPGIKIIKSIKPEIIVTPESIEKDDEECLADKIVTKDYNNPWYPADCHIIIRETLQCIETLRKVLDVIVERLANRVAVTEEDVDHLKGEVEFLSDNMDFLIWNEIIAEKKIIITKSMEERMFNETGLTTKQFFEILNIKSNN